MTKYNLEDFEKWLEERKWDEENIKALKKAQTLKKIDRYEVEPNVLEWFLSDDFLKFLKDGRITNNYIFEHFIDSYNSHENWIKIKELEEHQKVVKTWMEEVDQTKEKIPFVQSLLTKKITSLEKQLINLAKQKIKNQKQAKELLSQLENNWKDKETELTTNIQELENSLQLHQQKIKNLEQQLTRTHQKLTQTQTNLTHSQQTNQQLQALYQTRKKQVLFIGVIGLAIILYLVWPPKKEKEEPRTWI